MDSGASDPRPLIGEPLSLDLLNSVWIDAGGTHDLLETLDGLAVWLRTRDLPPSRSEATRALLLQTRAAIAEHLAGPAGTAPTEPLNAVLRRGTVQPVLTPDGPRDVPVLDAPEHLAAWHCARDYLRLLTLDTSRIRRCAHPDCVLHFHDTSAKGDRRWCSMAGCGNRAKAARHYQRTRKNPR